MALDNPFDRIEFSAGSVLLAAVSGGSDSTALLHLLQASIERRRLDVRLVAATVDHGLREGSAEEARVVAAQARIRGVEHHTLTWTGDKPSTGLQQAARLARHALLANLAEQIGASAVLVGHTRDDQTETVIMRRKRGDGPGVAGMAPATLFERRVWFVRPLLRSSRDELRQWLQQRGIAWIDDPSNDNPAFERAAVRKALAGARDGDEQVAETLGLATAAARHREAVAQEAAVIISVHARHDGPDRFTLSRDALTPDGEACLHALRILLTAGGGVELLPDVSRSRSLMEQLLASRRGARASLSRCVIEVSDDGIVIRRERRSRPPPAAEKKAALPRPWGQFLPSFELAPAIEVAKLTGGAIPPALPWRV